MSLRDYQAAAALGIEEQWTTHTSTMAVLTLTRDGHGGPRFKIRSNRGAAAASLAIRP